MTGKSTREWSFSVIFPMLSFPLLFSYKEAGLFSLEAEVGCNFHGQQILHVWYKQ